MNWPFYDGLNKEKDEWMNQLVIALTLGQSWFYFGANRLWFQKPWNRRETTLRTFGRISVNSHITESNKSSGIQDYIHHEGT